MWPIWELIYTQAMQSTDTMSIPQEGGVGGISQIKDVRQVQNRDQAKIYKISVQMCYPSESISLCKPSIYDNSHHNVHVPFKS